MCETEVLRENPVPVPLCPPQHHMTFPVQHMSLHSEKLVTKCQSYGAVKESTHTHKAQYTASITIQEPVSNRTYKTA